MWGRAQKGPTLRVFSTHVGGYPRKGVASLYNPACSGTLVRGSITIKERAQAWLLVVADELS